MRLEEFGEAAAERACPVAVDDPDLRRAGESGLIEKFVNAARGFLDVAANQVYSSGNGSASGAQGLGAYRPAVPAWKRRRFA